MKDWISTYTGRRVFPLNMKQEDLCIEDIVHALANKCRYTGHCNVFYSVAQHCVLMSEFDLPGPPIWRLLHDAAEAYLPDVAHPIKHCFPNLIAAENHILELVQKAFQITVSFDSVSSDIKIADKAMMVWEGKNIMPIDVEANWGFEFTPNLSQYIFSAWRPEIAKSRFKQAVQKLLIRG